MEPARSVPPAPTEQVIRPGSHSRISLHELWAYRNLAYHLVWREVVVRYKQTMIGFAWAIIAPMLSVVVFTVVFGRFAGISSDGMPHILFYLAALVPWTYFSTAVNKASTSLTANYNLVTKIYFPRALLPAAYASVPVVDLLVSLLLVVGVVFFFDTAAIGPRLLLTLPLALLTWVLALGVSLWTSAGQALYRDVGHAVPFMVQAGLFVSPIAYSSQEVPDRFRPIYDLNPLVAIIDGFRWVLGGPPVDVGTVVSSVVISGVVLVAGLFVFQRLTSTIADVI